MTYMLCSQRHAQFFSHNTLLKSLISPFFTNQQGTEAKLYAQDNDIGISNGRHAKGTTSAPAIVITTDASRSRSRDRDVHIFILWCYQTVTIHNAVL